MIRLYPGARAGFEEALNAFVPEASDHAPIVACGATRNKEEVDRQLESPIPPKSGAWKLSELVEQSLLGRQKILSNLQSFKSPLVTH